MPEIAYTLTALSAEGRELVRDFTEGLWRRFMTTWETEINRYLAADSA